MRFGKRTLDALGAALAVSAAFMSACGGSDEQPSAERAKPTLASTAVIDKDPDAIACGHVRDQLKWDRETRRATVAIANREKFKDLNLLHAERLLRDDRGLLGPPRVIRARRRGDPGRARRDLRGGSGHAVAVRLTSQEGER